MALLNEEQINDILDITNVWESGIIVSNLIEWNEKQPSTQFEPDWSRAPKSAVGASVSLTWVTETGYNTLGYTLANYDRPAPVITPHPHAEMMAKYAEVARTRPDPWTEFERFLPHTGQWHKIDCDFTFLTNLKYRHIGDDK